MSTFPATPAPATLKISSIQPTLVSTAHSLQRQVRSRGGHRWLLSVTWPVLSRADWAQLYGFAQAQRGQFNPFTYVLPGSLASAAGIGAGAMPVVNGGSQSGRVVFTRNWGTSAWTTGILKAGDFIKFAGHNKVYMVTEDATADNTGHANVSIEPALFVAPADGESLIVSQVPFTMAFASDTRESDVVPGPYFSFQADMVEVP